MKTLIVSGVRPTKQGTKGQGHLLSCSGQLKRNIGETEKPKQRLHFEREETYIKVLQSKNVTNSLSHFMLHHPILWYGTSERGAVVKFVKYR